MNAIKTIKPMLASKVEDIKVDYARDVFIQPKLDGIRCIITKDGCYTRNGKEIKNVKHIVDSCEQLFERQPHLILDGEIYNHKLKDDFGKIISLARKQTPSERDIKESKHLLQFHWYDIACDGKQELRDRLRRSLFRANFIEYGAVRFVWSTKVNSEDHVQTMHKQFISQGYEGSILRLNGDYEYKRSKNLIKVKDWHDKEGIILDYVEGKGKFEGGLGKFIVIDEDGREVEVPYPSLTLVERKEMFKNIGDYIGKELTFEYFERTPSGAYRFPRAKCIRNYE